MKKKIWLFVSFGVFSSALGFSLSLDVFAAQVELCEERIRSTIAGRAERDGLPHFLAEAQRRVDRTGVLPATHSNLEEDMRRAETWGGVPAPRMIGELLIEGTTLIDHPLASSREAGTVTSASGHFTPLRVKVGDVGTNIGVVDAAILDNEFRPNKSYVRADAKAVVIFLHGGGTRTTGFHVGQSFMNHAYKYGVDVISVDGAWHGEGPRRFYNSPKAYFDEFLRPLIRKVAGAAGVPIFIAGHSWGGELADNYMRLYPNDDLVAGVIALSAVVDHAPGASPREKLEAQRRWRENFGQDPRINPADLALTRNMIEANKISLLGTAFEGLFSSQNDQSLPPDRGASYVPALFIWGTADWLYVGNEDLIARNIGGLKNVTLKLYQDRYDFVLRRVLKIGHLIFDHKRVTPVMEPLLREFSLLSEMEPVSQYQALMSRFSDLGDQDAKAQADRMKTENETVIRYLKVAELLRKASDESDHEAFSDMIDFIDLQLRKRLGSTGERILIPVPEDPKRDPRKGLRSHYVRTYASNLAFRVFADQYVDRRVKGTEKMVLVSKVLSALVEYDRQINMIQKNKKIPEANRLIQIEAIPFPTFDEVPAGLGIQSINKENYQEVRKVLSALQQGQFVPEGEAGVRGREWIEEMAAITQLTRALRLVEQTERTKLQRLEKEIRETDLKISQLLRSAKNTKLDELREQKEQLFKEAEAIQAQYDELAANFYIRKLELNRPLTPEDLRPSAELEDLFIAYEAAMSRFLEKGREIHEFVQMSALSGAFGGELRELMLKRYGDPSVEGSVAGSQEARKLRLLKYILDLTATTQQSGARSTNIRANLAETYTPDYFRVTAVHLGEVFNLPPGLAWSQHGNDLETAWSAWKEHWGNREPPEEGSLY